MQTRLCSRDGAGEVLLVRSGPEIISLGLMFLCFGLSQLMLVKSRFLFEVNTLLDFSSPVNESCLHPGVWSSTQTTL